MIKFVGFAIKSGNKFLGYVPEEGFLKRRVEMSESPRFPVVSAFPDSMPASYMEMGKIVKVRLTMEVVDE